MNLISSFHSSKIYKEDRASHWTAETKAGLGTIASSLRGWWPCKAAALSPSSGLDCKARLLEAPGEYFGWAISSCEVIIYLSQVCIWERLRLEDERWKARLGFRLNYYLKKKKELSDQQDEKQKLRNSSSSVFFFPKFNLCTNIPYVTSHHNPFDHLWWLPPASFSLDLLSLQPVLLVLTLALWHGWAQF